MPASPAPHEPIKGRGAQNQPANRYVSVQVEPYWDDVADDTELMAQLARPATIYLPDESQSIVSQNNSPDVSFRYSMNPYRGCSHGCSYCYARPTHEYYGLSAGLDFETKVMVKHRAPELFRAWLARPAWKPEWISMSGVTDCYQPVEREYELTRGCLAVAAECRQPMGIVTKNALVARDLDLLAELAHYSAAQVAVSITTLDAELARTMEPRTSSPEARLRTIRELTAAGVPTRVMVAPVIPGLNDSEIPAILAAAREAGASTASYILLRLPLTVVDVFFGWLERFYPDRVEKVASRIRTTREGELYQSKFGSRMRGEGEIARQIEQTFRVFRAKHRFDTESQPLDASHFRPPRVTTGQLRLFE
ncbi:PA0069 family radical SAM protein [Aeoliella sp. SH292]|uniref:PA0069 family radical SAM protein n=1 Tax=Aeoliella sp. SH292 TaxID=3454464 RepID=UPI003F97D79A